MAPISVLPAYLFVMNVSAFVDGNAARFWVAEHPFACWLNAVVQSVRVVPRIRQTIAARVFSQSTSAPLGSNRLLHNPMLARVRYPNVGTPSLLAV